MTINKYSNILTVVLVILAVAILTGGGILFYNYVIKPNKDRERKIEAIEEFDKEFKDDDKDIEEEPEQQEEEEEQQEEEDEKKQGDSIALKYTKKKYYNNFPMIGYITIPKTNVKEPILETVTPESLNTAVAVLYPSNPILNEPGNVVIIGHNYKNGTFFSNNKKLVVGDQFQIKDTTGRSLIYTIYQKFITTDQDTSFYNRDTNGAVEVTLSTCTDDAKQRIIILARVEQ